MTVTLKDIEKALTELCISQGDIVLVHSSLKSFGTVEGGPETVIQAFKNVITEQGTLVMPTLSQKNFRNAIEDWHMDRPSDVGLITETFRKMPGSLRSNQETHSVSAWGKDAKEITCEHKAYGPRYGTFGEWAFSESSPWQKMYDMHAKVVFVGVTMMYNTFKHFVEYRMIEEILDNVKKEEYDSVKAQLRYSLGENAHDGIWPFYNSEAMQDELDKLGLVKHTDCGNSHIICVPVHKACDESERMLKQDISRWVADEKTVEWFKKYGNY